MCEIRDRVRTLNDLEGFEAGAEGVVNDTDSRGNLIVDLDKAADGTVLDPPQPLMPHGPENFEKIE